MAILKQSEVEKILSDMCDKMTAQQTLITELVGAFKEAYATLLRPDFAKSLVDADNDVEARGILEEAIAKAENH